MWLTFLYTHLFFHCISANNHTKWICPPGGYGASQWSNVNLAKGAIIYLGPCVGLFCLKGHLCLL